MILSLDLRRESRNEKKARCKTLSFCPSLQGGGRGSDDERAKDSGMGHLTLFCAVPLASFHVTCFLSNSAILVRHQCAGVFLSLPLWVPLQGPLDYMSIWSPQRVANPSSSSLSYLLIYRSLPCLSSVASFVWA